MIRMVRCLQIERSLDLHFYAYSFIWNTKSQSDSCDVIVQAVNLDAISSALFWQWIKFNALEKHILCVEYILRLLMWCRWIVYIILLMFSCFLFRTMARAINRYLFADWIILAYSQSYFVSICGCFQFSIILEKMFWFPFSLVLFAWHMFVFVYFFFSLLFDLYFVLNLWFELLVFEMSAS